MGKKRKVFIALKMAGIAGQSKLAGAFRYLNETYGDSSPWDVQLVRTKAELTAAAVRQAYIYKHALGGIGVTDVVRHLGCSRRLADLRFRELQKRTILDAITKRRLDEVKRRLAQTWEKMDAIASACGYKNPTYLKNLFKNRFGMSMSEWRSQNRTT